ncbi:MAG: hypothetical protein GC206_14145 [Alphaproteobacteria bacterium]|nr:hypothetical protein [Alphaproteobacteria bacterium]
MPRPKSGAGHERLRALALSLPDVEEKPHFDATSFRVRGKIFATVGESKSADECVLKMAPHLQQAMMEAHGDAFRPAAGAWGRSGWTHIVIPRLPPRVFEDLTVSAWALVAPKKLVAAHKETLARS